LFLLLRRFSILFQRAVYPPEDFTVKKKYGLNILVTINDELQLYMKQVCSQLEGMQAAICCKVSHGHSY
jgi:mitotic spindle assembly checkpoint protein MAD2